MRTELTISGKRCFIYENDTADIFLLQAVGEHDLGTLDREAELIKELAPDTPFTLAALLIEDWNHELSPWAAPAVFGNEGFGTGAADTLRFLTNSLIPTLEEVYGHNGELTFYLGGYSLSGLFALWAAYQTDIFRGIAAVSPSVWFPGWEVYMESHPICTSKVYLSLGDREEKTRNKMMSRVGDSIRRQHEVLCDDIRVKECLLEWNAGNHFAEPEVRCAKGFAWLLK